MSLQFLDRYKNNSIVVQARHSHDVTYKVLCSQVPKMYRNVKRGSNTAGKRTLVIEALGSRVWSQVGLHLLNRWRRLSIGVSIFVNRHSKH
jgi:hypothetical protein